MSDTAVLMIDMQNGYHTQATRDALGWPPIWRLDEVVGECSALLDAARATRWPIIYSRQTPSTAGPLAHNPRAGGHIESRSHLVPAISEEQKRWNQQIMDALEPAPGDVVLDKTRHSFFAYTELGPVLRTLGVQRVLIA